MTLVPRWWPRPRLMQGIGLKSRFFQITPDSQLLTQCHWHVGSLHRPTVILIHGLEGCSESHYMLGIARKAWDAGCHVVRMNQRNCGGTLHCTPTLYHGGLSSDVGSVVAELAKRDGLQHIWVVGYSMGGNLALKLAGEVGSTLPALKGVIAVCPNIDPAACVKALQQPRNRLYHHYFLTRLKSKLKRKAALYPEKFDPTPLRNIRTMWQFDDLYTAPDGGYRNAADYYERSGSRHVLHNIQIPTLIMTSKDDPFIPSHTFHMDAIRANPWIHLMISDYGGHCGFFQRRCPDEDYFWAENRVIEFIQCHQKKKIERSR